MSDPFSFIGEFSHSLDEKGRLALPGKLREELRKSNRPDEIVAFYNRKDGNLALYPSEQWQKIEEAIAGISNTTVRLSTARDFGRNSERLSIDKSGRVLLSQKHREAAGLSREVVVVGGLIKMEIWDRGKLQAQESVEEAVVLEALASEEVPL